MKINTIKITNPICIEYLEQIKKKEKEFKQVDIIDLSDCEYFCSAFIAFLYVIRKVNYFSFIPPKSKFLSRLLEDFKTFNKF